MTTSGGQDLYLGHDGGYAVPRDSAIGIALREHFDKLLRRHGDSELLPIYLEQGVFNFYLEKLEITSLESAVPPPTNSRPGQP